MRVRNAKGPEHVHVNCSLVFAAMLYDRFVQADPSITDPERVGARMGKCFIPDCEAKAEWYCYSWWRYCDEHVPEPAQDWSPSTKWREPYLFHRFK